MDDDLQITYKGTSRNITHYSSRCLEGLSKTEKNLKSGQLMSHLVFEQSASGLPNLEHNC
jgi:hypothetical protein